MTRISEAGSYSRSIYTANVRPQEHSGRYSKGYHPDRVKSEQFSLSVNDQQMRSNATRDRLREKVIVRKTQQHDIVEAVTHIVINAIIARI